MIESTTNVTKAAALLADVSMNDLFVQRKVRFGDIAILRLQPKSATTCNPRVGALLAGSAAPPSLSKGDTLLVSSSPFGLVAPQVFMKSLSAGIASNFVPTSSVDPNNSEFGSRFRATPLPNPQVA
jgi:hypothetical protein